MRVVFLFSVLFVFCTAGYSLTLEEAFEKAKQQSESLKITKERITEAEAIYNEAIASVYPNVNLLLTERLRNGEGTSNSDFGSSGSFSGPRKDRFQSSVNLIQPIFSGFRDFLLADAAEAEISARKLTLSRSTELLFLNVAEVYLQVLLYQKDLAELEATGSVLKKRVDEIGEFVKLGKAREGETFAAEADIAENAATKSNVEGLLKASKEMLSFLTGIPSKDIKINYKTNASKVEPVSFYLELGKKRADILASELQIQSAEKQLTATEREHWPDISLEGNYYPYENPDQDRSAEVLFRLSLPIFDGGAIDARAAQKASQLRTASLNSEELKRKTESDIRTAYVTYHASEEEYSRFKEFVAKTKKNYESQKHDYTTGVVTNLDVLQSIRQLREAQRRLTQADIQRQVNRIRLKASSGEFSS